MRRTKQFLIVAFAVALQSRAYTQATNNSPANNFYSGGFLGWTNTNGANPLLIKTNNITRMHFNGSTGGYGVNTSGFIGIGTSTPAAPLHIFGSGSQNAMGWQRGITLSNAAALMFDGGGGSGFFMAHPSGTPLGNFYGGIGANLSSTASVNYAYSISVNSPIGMNPLASVDFYKNVIVYQTTFERKFGVNVLDPARVSEIYDGGGAITDAQLRLSTSGNRWTDFRTTSSGEMLITPEGGKVGITDGGTSISTTATLDINGDTRIRNVQTAVPDALFVGEQVTGQNDLNVRRLDFTGNPNDVLQGDGTWGTGASPITANNGITLTPGDVVQLGELYNVVATVPLLNNREVRMNNRNFVFSRTSSANTGNVGIGLIFPSAPTQRLDVDGNARLRTLPLAVNQASASVNKIEMVDSTGVLKWSSLVPSSFGTICSDTLNSIFTEHRKVNLNDNNFYFEGNADTIENNNVGFGWACGTPIKAKVDAIQFGEGGIGGSFMVFENWQNGINNISPTGVIGVSNGNGNGGAGYIGVNGIALGSNSAYCYGIYGSAGNAAINRAGFFNGDIEIINGFLTSDQQFKTNTTAIPSALKIVSSLNPKTYYFDTLNF